MSVLDLRTYNPLVTVLGPLPLMVVLLVTRDVLTPGAVAVATLLVLLAGTRPPARVAAALLLGTPLLVALLTVSFGVWTDPDAVDRGTLLAQVGPVGLWTGSLATGLATALRTAAVVLLALVGALAATGPDLVRSAVQHLRVPYRVGYAALAALRFVPRFGRELELVRGAHRVRGTAAGRGPVAAVRRRAGYAVPLLAGGIRHAERVALAMDARAFGAHATRTERQPVPLRARDGALLVVAWAGAAVLLLVLVPLLQHRLALLLDHHPTVLPILTGAPT